MREIEKTYYKIVISEDTQNKTQETFISMKFDTECNETIHAIILYHFDEYNEIRTKMMSNSWSGTIQIVKLEKKKRRTDMESPIFETLETAVTCSVSIPWTLENR